MMKVHFGDYADLPVEEAVRAARPTRGAARCSTPRSRS
ncbi:hypothetical protein I553_1862 [Mycobacterium xenopi 4042]|uniref:Uncharacterized protein n=1 Tax=Mycobacterium xenopi 4042 TaxID=1299334 RepID=X8DJU3_MYCXE|nr:hypothetical protein I553_1862 [Mycobacterium xenopi 4042]